jgi:hypothetical protein
MFKPANFWNNKNIASVREGKILEKYRLDGWKILNKSKRGSILGKFLKWSKENCLEIGLKFKFRNEFKKNFPSVYTAIIKNKWSYFIFSHIKYKYSKSNETNNNRC